MPNYSYTCQDCGKRFQLSVTLAEKEAGTAEKLHCPACKSRKIKSHFSLCNFLTNIFAKEAKNCCCSDSKTSCCK